MIDPNKKYKTRDGREVRIYATDGAEPYTVHGAIRRATVWTPESWLSDGAFDSTANSRADLIEVKPEVTVRRYVLISVREQDCNDLWTSGLPGGYSGVKQIGAIDITHNGDKIVKVEVVDE